MQNTNRREMLYAGLAFMALPGTVLNSGWAADEDTKSKAGSKETNSRKKVKTMKIQYLEFVTPNVDAVCATYSAVHGVKFGDPDPSLGGARTAKMADGGMLGVRAPMRDTEAPIVRPYFLTDDIAKAVAAAEKAGAKIAMPPMKLEGHGTFAIFIQDGIESGLWEL